MKFLPLLGIVAFLLLGVGYSTSFEMRMPGSVSCESMSMWPIFTCENRLYGVIPTFEEKQNLPLGTIVVYDMRPFDHLDSALFFMCREYGFSYAIHRIIGKNPDGTYLLKGDNNEVPDEFPVLPGQIIFLITRVDGG